MSTNKTNVTKDFQAKSIVVSREFDAPVADVWRAFTESKLLDQWWGPSPWRAETKKQDFTPGGFWLYAMVGPEDQRHWARMDYLSITHHKGFEIEDSFCDENGTINPELPVSKGHNVFKETATGTTVEFKMIYPTEQSLQTIVEMGFEQGISICFDQLEVLLKK
ncbi:SRPBCC domain-containing protein [Lacibacter luteus]|uniref:SRPBCC domain-containing protein n=1 Tax=Lacibacter luteus TaxID=2508719 RepID=A0A4Q1CMT2_9BACT|nr:SRPBCC domain-containing protein [Lacibacter luteus]RXK62363.1 SRPBCC domain-containing protein [Lacibacter luteus]